MKLEKKHIVFGALSVISIALGVAYLQYRKLMNYCIGYNRIVVNSIDLKNFNFDLFLNFKNQSDLKIEITKTNADVYLNKKLLTTISNTVPQIIQPQSMSVLGFNVLIDAKKAGDILEKNIGDLLFHRENIVIKVDLKLSVKFYFINVNVPFQYESTLKDMIAKKEGKTSGSKGKCK